MYSSINTRARTLAHTHNVDCVYCSWKYVKNVCHRESNKTRIQQSGWIFLITVLSLSLFRSHVRCVGHAFLLSNFTGTVYFSNIYLFRFLSMLYLFLLFFLVLILYHFFPFIRIRMWNRRIWKMMGLKNGRIHLATLVAFNNWYIFFNYFMRHASFLMHLLLLSRILWNWWFAYGNHEKKCWSLLIFPLFFDRKSRKFPRSHVWHSLCFVCRPNSTICDLFLTKAVVFFF